MSRSRLWIAVAFLAIGMVTVICRAMQVMVIEHDTWQQLAERQQQRLISVPSKRGEIRSADGYVLATSVSRVAIQVDCQELPYPRLFAAAAAPLLGTSAAELERRLQGKPRALWLAKQVARDTGLRVRALAPGAIVLVPDSERVYPLGSVAAPVVGFTGREELRIVGRVGLEHLYDALLTGEPDRYRAVRDAVQRQLRLQRLNRGRSGYDLELTLLARLQAECEAEMQRAVDEMAARGGSAVVLDAYTGEILALVSIPNFDPSSPGEVPPEQWRLRPVQDAYEPGSTIKPLIAAAALASPSYRPGRRYDCRQRGITVAGRWIRDHADPGIYDLDEVVTHSSNAGIIMVAQEIEPQLLWRALDAFGLGQRTDVGFPAETAGILPVTSSWSAMSPAGLSLGQEVTVSPLQMALAYAVIANGGWLPRPHLVRSAGAGSHAMTPEAGWRRRVLDRRITKRLQHMLEMVVEDGTGSLARVPGMRVAGKTGTAQAMTDGTFDNRHHAPWFAGFFPMPAPRYVVVVTLDNPLEDFWASNVTAPVFSRIAAATARLADIPPQMSAGEA